MTPHRQTSSRSPQPKAADITPHISTNSLDTIRSLLLSRRDSVARVLDALRQEPSEAFSGRDLSDLFDEEPCPDIDVGQSMMLAQQAAQCLSQIEEAIGRLANGTYGYCVDCGQGIPIDRLQALPATERCIECSRLSSQRHGKSPTNSAA